MQDSGPFVVEKFINYDYEASIIAVRGSNGNFQFLIHPSITIKTAFLFII